MFLDWPISQTDKDELVEAATEAIDDSLAAAKGSGLQDYVLFYCWIPAEIWALLLSTTVGRMQKFQLVLDMVNKLGCTRPTGGTKPPRGKQAVEVRNRVRGSAA